MIFPNLYSSVQFRLKQCGLRKPIYLIEDFGSIDHLSIPASTLRQATVNTQVSTSAHTLFVYTPVETSFVISFVPVLNILPYTLCTKFPSGGLLFSRLSSKVANIKALYKHYIKHSVILTVVFREPFKMLFAFLKHVILTKWFYQTTLSYPPPHFFFFLNFFLFFCFFFFFLLEFGRDHV